MGPLPRTVRLPIAARGLPLLAHPFPRVVVDFERLLLRAVLWWHVAQIDPDPCPGRAPPAHRVDHHVCELQVRHNIGVTRLPAFEAVERLLLRGRARDPDASRGRP